MKLANGNTGNAQGIGIILCHFINCLTIYPVVPVHYCPSYPSKKISSGDLKFYVGFQKVTYKPLKFFDFVDPQSHSWRSPYQNINNIDYIQIEIFQFNPQRNWNIVVQTVCALLKIISLILFISTLVMSLMPG